LNILAPCGRGCPKGRREGEKKLLSLIFYETINNWRSGVYPAPPVNPIMKCVIKYFGLYNNFIEL
jgi:hypothetical protein